MLSAIALLGIFLGLSNYRVQIKPVLSLSKIEKNDARELSSL
jgi:hypothetical protein